VTLDAEATLPLPRFEDRLWDELAHIHPAGDQGSRDRRPHRRRYVAGLVALAGAAAVVAVALVATGDDDRDRTQAGEPTTTTTVPAAAPTTTVEVPAGLTLHQLTTRLTTGPDAVEGFTAEGLQAALADPELRSRHLPPDEPSFEGTLLPGTYELPDGATESDLVAMMVERFETVADEVDLEDGAARLGFTPYEVLIVASLVDVETRHDEERPQVARVIYNRLGQGIALGIDATSCYEQDPSPCLLTAEDLSRDTPYNTRVNRDLPPTPISSPGRASIEAALHPADGDWIYYAIVDDDAHHLFTSDFAEFQEAIGR
jgi:UPF0755 protein